jgi:hypothetical protein
VETFPPFEKQKKEDTMKNEMKLPKSVEAYVRALRFDIQVQLALARSQCPAGGPSS